MKYQKIVAILSCLLLSSCFVSRLKRPLITGVITDFDGNPIENCTIGETTTDQNGNYLLPELRYRQFLSGLEAPPLFVSEQITKEGYYNKNIERFSNFGGAARKGAKWELDTIRLKKENQKLLDITNTGWKISATKNNDTIYFIKSNYRQTCISYDCQNFYSQYHQYADNYYNSNSRNLPEGILKRYLSITFKPKAIFKGQKIIQYRDNKESLSKQKPNDTIQITGEWNSAKDIFTIKSELKEFQGTFKLTDFDYEYMQWVKTSSL